MIICILFASNIAYVCDFIYYAGRSKRKPFTVRFLAVNDEKTDT